MVNWPLIFRNKFVCVISILSALFHCGWYIIDLIHFVIYFFVFLLKYYLLFILFLRFVPCLVSGYVVILLRKSFNFTVLRVLSFLGEFDTLLFGILSLFLCTTFFIWQALLSIVSGVVVYRLVIIQLSTRVILCYYETRWRSPCLFISHFLVVFS